MPAKVLKSDAEWRARLTPLQYNVTRRRGTERAYTGNLRQSAPGSYHCVCCSAPLFSSEARLADGKGWPSFSQPVAPDALRLEEDYGWMTAGTEALCARCDAHLGHALEDGSGRHFCVNSAALRFIPSPG